MTLIRRPFDYDPVTGVTETFYYDPDEDIVTIESSLDVEPLLEQCKALHARTDQRARWRPGFGERVASIPSVVLHEYLQKGIDLTAPEFEPELRKLLNDPEYRFFRTRPGRV